MNYRHIYHAGNFADLIKHLILIAILEKMKEKKSAYTILDAFAGIGIYDLNSVEASKTLEYQNGFGIFADNLSGANNVPDVCLLYKDIIDQINLQSQNMLYPGSPYIISKLIRKEDKMIACELHEADYMLLKQNIGQNIHNIDAYNAIKAFLPPEHNRGLVLLDPAFEVKNEFERVIDALKLIYRRFQNGIVMIWYPIKDTKQVNNFYSDLGESHYKEFLKIEFEVDIISEGMNKSGIIIANPPYIINTIELIMKFLSQDIYKGRLNYTINYIT